MAHVSTKYVKFDPITKRIPMAGRVVSLTTLVLVLGGCSFIARSPDQYRNDTSNLLATKAPELNLCFDNARKTTPGASGKVTVRFSVEKKTGKILNAAADPSRTTAPQPLIDCVIASLNGLVLNPPDQRNGDATFDYDFAAPAQAATAPKG
jgi:hypothetical protein